jgi:hypothetical protein
MVKSRLLYYWQLLLTPLKKYLFYVEKAVETHSVPYFAVNKTIELT